MWPAQVVNLRPLGVGERIDAAIKIVRAKFLHPRTGLFGRGGPFRELSSPSSPPR